MARNRSARRNRKRGRSAKKRFSLVPWALAAVALVALVALISPRQASGHPTPRRDAATRQVAELVSPSRYAGYPRIQETYREAALVPQVLDGVYCYCYCERHAGHYSLLDCYKSDHAAGCDVCLSEGALAYKLHKEGKSLDQIRAAIDQLYRT